MLTWWNAAHRQKLPSRIIFRGDSGYVPKWPDPLLLCEWGWPARLGNGWGKRACKAVANEFSMQATWPLMHTDKQ